MPDKSTPLRGRTCGRRERESRREGRRDQKPSARNDSFACRNGERHPGLPESDALRGASSERRPRSVRQRVAVSSAANRRADDSGCPEVAEEGNDVGMRHQAYAPDAGTRDRRMRQGTRPSLGPTARARRSSLHTAGAILGGEAFEVASRLGKLARARGTFPGADTNGRSAARRVSPLPQGRGRDTTKRKEIEVSVLRGSRARVWLPARRNVVAEVGRRRLVSNTLGKRAPKRAVRVE